MRYQKFSEAIKDNYDKIIDYAIDVEKESYDYYGMRAVIEIDLNGDLSTNWYISGGNEYSSSVYRGDSVEILEFDNGNPEVQRLLDDTAEDWECSREEVVDEWMSDEEIQRDEINYPLDETIDELEWREEVEKDYY